MFNYIDCEIQLFDDEINTLTPKIIANLFVDNKNNCFQIDVEIMPFCPEQENGIYFLNEFIGSQNKPNYWIYVDNYFCSNVFYNLNCKSMGVDCLGRDLLYCYSLVGK